MNTLNFYNLQTSVMILHTPPKKEKEKKEKKKKRKILLVVILKLCVYLCVCMYIYYIQNKLYICIYLYNSPPGVLKRASFTGAERERRVSS